MDASPQIIVPGGSSAKSASVWEADGLSRARVTAHARHTGGAVTRVGARASLRHLGGFECVHAGPSHAPRRRSASESCFFDKLSESVSQKVLPEPVPWKRVRPSGSTCQRPRTPATRHVPRARPGQAASRASVAWPRCRLRLQTEFSARGRRAGAGRRCPRPPPQCAEMRQLPVPSCLGLVVAVTVNPTLARPAARRREHT